MRETVITAELEGRRLDRCLQHMLPAASTGFIYKMLRKKNITLNDRKATGREAVRAGDVIRVWFSEETFEKFAGDGGTAAQERTYPCRDLDILYEDEDVIFINKPVGMLSQKAAPDDVSLCEYLAGYLLRSGQAGMKQLAEVPPSACNRLDRNTSGIVACGKSVKGLQGLAVLLRERQVEKHYRCIVYGRVSGSGVLTGYLKKDRKANQVSVSLREEEGSKEIVTAYRPLMSGIAPGHTEVTLLDVSPKTGRSHQIRAHLTFAGHPLLGDTKYTCADKAPAAPMGLKGQLLHCACMRFGDADVLPQLKDMSVTAPLPAHFSAIMDMIDWDTMEDGQ